MARLTGLLAAASIVGLTVASVSAQTLGGRPATSPILQAQQARLAIGSMTCDIEAGRIRDGS